MPSHLVDPSFSATRAHIHLDRLRSNVQAIQQRMPGLDMMGVVKADAYGHGSVAVATALRDMGIRHFGVATVGEAASLRAAGIEESIMVFAPLSPPHVKASTALCLDVVIDSTESLEAARGTDGRLRCHIKVDTGMGRLGRTPEDSIDIVRGIEADTRLDMGSIWTHFARADEPDHPMTGQQISRFMDFIETLGGAPAPLHVAASAGVFAHPDSIDPNLFSMARVGIALYGLLDLPGARPPSPLSPVMEFSSTVTSLKHVSAGTPISYGSRWKAPAETWIATVGAGYADGVSRTLSGKGRVRIGNELYPIVGTVCMDMFMVNLGKNPFEVRVGDNAILFGKSAPTAFEVADHMDSITYVPVCAVSSRVPRDYVLG